MTRTGRPLRFLALVLGGWIAMRFVAWTLPADRETAVAMRTPRSAETTVPAIQPASAPRVAMARPSSSRLLATRRESTARRPEASAHRRPDDAGSAGFDTGPPSGQTAFHGHMVLTALDIEAPDDGPAGALFPRPIPSGSSGARRWSLSGWALWRPEAGPSPVSAPLLGGSQAGLRFDYRFSERAGLYVRASRAFARPFAEEAAIGISVRPVAALPVSVMAERRQKLGDGGRSDFALLAAGGIGPAPVGPRVELEGYAQAGIVGLRDGDAFADGRLSLSYRLTPDTRGPDLALGFSTWASAQPGAQRLDIGPELRLRLPVGAGRLRLSAEWRERIAGGARPASGPAVTLIAEF